MQISVPPTLGELENLPRDILLQLQQRVNAVVSVTSSSPPAATKTVQPPPPQIVTQRSSGPIQQMFDSLTSKPRLLGPLLTQYGVKESSVATSRARDPGHNVHYVIRIQPVHKATGDGRYYIWKDHNTPNKQSKKPARRQSLLRKQSNTKTYESKLIEAYGALTDDPVPLELFAEQYGIPPKVLDVSRNLDGRHRNCISRIHTTKDADGMLTIWRDATPA